MSRKVSLRSGFPILSTAQGSTGQTVRTQFPAYEPNETIVVQFEGLPGNAQDWITLTAASRPDDHYGEYFFTQEKPSEKNELQRARPRDI